MKVQKHRLIVTAARLPRLPMPGHRWAERALGERSDQCWQVDGVLCSNESNDGASRQRLRKSAGKPRGPRALNGVYDLTPCIPQGAYGKGTTQLRYRARAPAKSD
jgi:hypothetical protein